MKTRALLFILFTSIFSAFFWIANAQGKEFGISSVTVTPTPLVSILPTSMPFNWQTIYNKNQSNDSNLALAAPIRGTLDDEWADVIIGQPDFGQITPNEVVGNKLFNPGGVYVDRSVQPNRVYVYDAGNSRVLGFRYLGTAQGGPEDGQSCTSNSDHPGSVCVIDPTRSADIVLGQNSFMSSACNGDSAMQNYPVFPSPSKTTLCGLNPISVSILEGGSMAAMATDSEGNFYFPDFFNSRVLRYNNPFATDSVADYVWGQSDFVSADCNMGASYDHPNNKSLCLASPPGHGNTKTGVATDSQGNLWVADTQNNRVLRFPFDPASGVPASTADLVLGQPDFNTATFGTGLNQMGSPTSVRVDNNGNIYVADGEHYWTHTIGRILIFRPPLSNGMSASQMIQSGIAEPTAVELDPAGGFWVNDSDNQRVLRFDNNGNLQQTVNGVPSRTWGGIGIDRDSNLMITGWDPQQVLVYTPPSYTWTSTFLRANEYGSFNQEGPRGLTDPEGLEVVAGQMIVADGPRLLFWNGPQTINNNYPSADGLIGQSDFQTRPRWGKFFGRMRADNQGRLWVIYGPTFDSGTAQINAYQLPLTTGAIPILTISSPLPLQGGGTFTWSWSLIDGGLAYQPDCDCLWVSDRDYNRVFRIAVQKSFFQKLKGLAIHSG
ncbi:MAG: hypothetical protein HZB19_15935 [Chloroflexi bacterium]|nr:hypothetical protein [Chloroflexota bacterium]